MYTPSQSSRIAILSRMSHVLSDIFYQIEWCLLHKGYQITLNLDLKVHHDSQKIMKAINYIAGYVLYDFYAMLT